MPDVDTMSTAASSVPGWAWPAGVTALFIAVKYLWPLMRQSLDTQLTQGRTESGLLNQVMLERDKALARAEAAEKRADELFSQLAEVKAQLKIMSFKLETANHQIEALSAKINELIGTPDA